MARVLLIAAPYLDLYGGLSRAAGRYFPLGLGYVASYLKKYGGHEVMMIEPEAQRISLGRLGEMARDYGPDVVGLTSATPNFSRVLELARAVRSRTSARIVLGGVHASALPEYLARRHADLFDAVVSGEGEETMLDVVAAFGSSAGLSTVPGIAFCSSAGAVVRTPRRPLLKELDRLPPPARELIPQDLFFPNLHNARHRNCATILTSRGCPFDCSFCASRVVSGRGYRTHSPEYVIEEMRMLKKDFGIRQILITDDTFTLDRKRAEKICEGMIAAKLGLTWFCFSQVNTVDRDLLRLMKEAGCYSIGFGVESSDTEVLATMGKHINPERALLAIRTANELGIKTQAFYVFGNRGETRAQMEATVRFAMRARSTLVFFNMLVPYPGTRDFDFYFKDADLDSIAWDDFVAVGERCVLAGSPVSPREMERLIASAYLKYYASPARLLAILRQMRTLREFKACAAGATGLAAQILRWTRWHADQAH